MTRALANQFLRQLKMLVPPSIRPWTKGALKLVPALFKHQEEIDYWRNEWRCGRFANDYYRRTMLGMAGQADEEFLRGKIVGDFGCGPQGSLEWAKTAKIRIGIDVLANLYSEFGIASHSMAYVCSTERWIPLPSNYVDVMYTLNALDHVSNLRAMCQEIIRVLAPGGLFLGSFNLWEEATFSEPQTLTEEKLQAEILRHLEVIFYRIAAPGPSGDTYGPFFEGKYIDQPCEGAHLWVRAIKPI
jgi:SAM-dependent methyltransferase